MFYERPLNNNDNHEKEEVLQQQQQSRIRAKPTIKRRNKHNILNNDAVAPPPVGSLPRQHPLPAFGLPPKPMFTSPNFSQELRKRLRTTTMPTTTDNNRGSNSIPSPHLHTNNYIVGSVVDSPPPAPTISFDERKKLFTNDRGNNFINNDRSANKQEEGQSQQKAIISTSTTSGSTNAASLVVCGVDGTVYTLDAYTGKLRNMFSSGPALVVTSSPGDDDDDASAATDDDETTGHHQGTTQGDDEDLTRYAVASKILNGNRKERVIPGLLDGRLYSVFQYEMESVESVDDDDDDDSDKCSSYDYVTETCERGDVITSSSSINIPSTRIRYTLTPHHIRVMDVVDSPFSTCTYNEHHSNNHENKQHCGIILGSKKVTIYAIEPMTGKVKWQQDPQGGCGKRGYTTRPPPRNKKSGNAGAIDGRTVLLQREDYVVKHTDAEDGSEVWKIELGMFMPLDFGGLDNNVNRSLNQQQQGGPSKSNDDDIFTNSDRTSSGVVGGSGRKRGIAAIAASVEEKKKSSSSSGVPSFLGSKRDSLRAGSGNNKERLFDDNEEDDDLDHDHSNRDLPSISFGKDRKTLMAVDVISREVIWSCKIDSEVAIVLGVDKESKWTELDVIEESAIFTNGQSTSFTRNDAHTHRPSSSPVYGSNLTPYGEAVEEEDDHFGRHGSHMFVRTKFEVVDEIDDGYNLLPQGITPNNEIGNDFHPPKFSIYPTEFNPSEMMMPDSLPPLSHRTEHGLYLTWSMVVSVVLISLSVIVFFARVIILRQKRKWEKKAASQDVTSPPSSSEDESISQSVLPARKIPPAPTSGGNFYTDILTKKKTLFRRSMSVGFMESQNSLGSRITAESDLDGAASNLLNKSLNSPRLSALPSTLGTKTLTTEASSELKESRPRLDSIDGIPLVRYSRYTSEFKEILPLGRGGFGTVFQCRNVLDGREYAIKKIRIASPLSVDGNVTKQLSQKLHRVLREVKCLALLDHPNIVRYYTAWLEVDQHDDDDETHTTKSIFDLKGSGRIFSGGLFSGFASNSMAMRLPFSKRTSHGSGILGLFGSLPLDESKSVTTHQHDDPNNDSCKGDDDDDDDLGFTWERSKENTGDHLQKEVPNVDGSQSSFGSCTGDNGLDATAVDTTRDIKHAAKFPESTINEDKETKPPEGRQILFIQMQLCSVQTLADFLASREARCGTIPQCSLLKSQYAVDVPYALRLFAQIAQGIKHVHKQGLIHRDLKPQNCFIDDAEGVVKVGDFGLSRESSTSTDITNNNESYEDVVAVKHPSSREAENTVGVGTRAYASPEQMRGSDYDASTDVFSLGLILFELLYPMYTAMERYKEFANIRKRIFPSYWNSQVRSSFPTVHDLLIQMISDSASARPTADAVSERIDSLLREYSIQSLDKSWGTKGALLLRVEAKDRDGILATTMQLIRDAAPLAKVLQYGLRGQNSKAVMEFALEVKDDEKLKTMRNLRSRLEDNDMSIRQVTNS